MLVERWEALRHLAVVESWLVEHGMAIQAGEEGFYPDTGFVIDRAVCGFLYLTNAPKIGYIDNVIGDPRVPRGRRREALGVLCRELLIEAHRHGIELLYAHTAHASLIDICKSHGFVPWGTGFTALIAHPRR